MRLRQLVINEEMFFEWFTEGRKTLDFIVAGGIPAGSRLAGIKYNAHNREIAFIVANKDFPESDIIKHLQITITAAPDYDSLSSLDDSSFE